MEGANRIETAVGPPHLRSSAVCALLEHLPIETREEMAKRDTQLAKLDNMTPIKSVVCELDYADELSFCFNVLDVGGVKYQYTLTDESASRAILIAETKQNEENVRLFGTKLEKMEQLVEKYINRSVCKFKTLFFYGIPPQWNSCKKLNTKNLFFVVDIKEANLNVLNKMLKLVGPEVETNIDLFSPPTPCVFSQIDFPKNTELNLILQEFDASYILEVKPNKSTLKVMCDINYEECSRLSQSLHMKDIGFSMELHFIYSRFEEYIFLPRLIAVLSEQREYKLYYDSNQIGAISESYDKQTMFSIKPSTSQYQDVFIAVERKGHFSNRNANKSATWKQIESIIKYASYEKRKQISTHFDWQNVFPYHIISIVVDLNHLKITIEEDNNSVKHYETDIFSILRECVFHPLSKVDKVKIIGFDEKLCKEANLIIKTDELILDYPKEYPEKFFNLFREVRLSKLTITSMTTIRNGQELLANAQQVINEDESSAGPDAKRPRLAENEE